MKIIKPLRLGIQHRHFRWQQQDHLALTVVAHISLSAGSSLLHDHLAWALQGDDIDIDPLFDQFMPKPVPEFLVSGFGYTAHQDEKRVCAVSAQLGDREKRLTIYGDRFWNAGEATEPLPFSAMPLGRARAFGGPRYAENPGGRGHEASLHGTLNVQVLPNIEQPDRPIHSPRQVPDRPAGFGMLDLAAASQVRRIGSYHADYMEQDFPGLPRDTDWQYFNVAPIDQRWQQQDRLPPALPYVLRNLHPDLPVQAGTLPDAQARCFLTRKSANGQQFEEAPLRLTTVWFFPHKDSAVLLYHGNVPTADSSASDILHLMPAYEATGMERPLAHYESVLVQRSAAKTGILHVFREQDLVTPSLIGAGFDTDGLSELKEGPLAANLRRRGESAKEQQREAMQAAGHPTQADTADAVPRLRYLSELPEFKVKLAARIAEMETSAAGQKDRLRAELQSQPASPLRDRLLAQCNNNSDTPFDLEAMSAQLEAMWAAAPAGSRLPGSLDEAKAKLTASYRQTASFAGAAGPMDKLRAAVMRSVVLERYQRDRDLSGMNLTGADLSGMVLSGANLRGSLLESADLSGTQLDEADLSDAVMVRTRLHRTSLRGARCKGTNFSKSSARQACFTRAAFSDSTWWEIDWQDCDVSAASFEKIFVHKSLLEACRFDGASFKEWTVLASTVRRATFVGATIYLACWLESTIQECCFDACKLTRSGWVKSDASACDFKGARLDACFFVHETSMLDTDFSSAHLTGVNLRGTLLLRSRFDRATVEDCDLSGAQLVGASMQKMRAARSLFMGANLQATQLQCADLSAAILQGADLRAADATSAVLFGADLGLVVTDASSVFDGVLAERANVYPRAKAAA